MVSCYGGTTNPNLTIIYPNRECTKPNLTMERGSSVGRTPDSVSVSASYCIPQCVRLIAGVCTHYVVYNISKKKNTVDKSKIKDKRKVKPKDKSWVKIGWRTKNRKGWCVQKR